MNCLVLVAIFVPVFAYLYGRIRRLEGSPVTHHEQMVIALVGWAVLLPAVMVPAVLGTVAAPIENRFIAVAILLGVAVGPLAVYQLIHWSLRLVRRWEGRA